MQYKLQGLKKSSNLCAINICETPQEQKRGYVKLQNKNSLRRAVSKTKKKKKKNRATHAIRIVLNFTSKLKMRERYHNEIK